MECSLLSSRTTIHKTGIPIAALDVSPQRTHAILAGRDILKTVRVQEGTCAEDFNLRSAIIAYASTHNTSGNTISAQHRDQLAANDVKWSHGRFDTTIVTAAANGRIVLYDINRAGVELARLHEHNRQVHKVAFSPYQGALLLSGSQDATIRLWDVRQLAGERNVMTCRSVNQYHGNNESVRDLKWSPVDAVEFAAGTDNGVVQRWDIRNDKAPLVKINAHDKTCHTVDWHPDGQYLASSGTDKNVKIWDFASTDRRMKPHWQFRAPQSVYNIRWRPPGWSSDFRSLNQWQCTHIATSYDHHDPRIHVWDVHRPSKPLLELDRYDSPPTDMLWRSEDLLWSVGTTGMFTQTDVNFAPLTLERRSANLLCSTAEGQLGFFADRRSRRRRLPREAPTQFAERANRKGSTAEKLSSSQSATDGSFEETSILSSSLRMRRAKTANARSLRGMSPSTGRNHPPARFEDIMRAATEPVSQITVYGSVPGVFYSDGIRFFSQNYQLPLGHSSYELPYVVGQAFEENARLAAFTSQYRLAQSWRILGLALAKELEACAGVRLCHQRNHLKLEGRNISSPEHGKIKERSWTNRSLGTDHLIGRSNTPTIIESSSNATTPLAMPVQDSSTVPVVPESFLSPNGRNNLDLPPPVLGINSQLKQQESYPQGSRTASEVVVSNGTVDTETEIKNRNSAAPHTHTVDVDKSNSSLPSFGSFTAIDHRMDERRAAIDNYRAQPRPLLKLDGALPIPKNSSLGARLDRHDSNESFQMFSASTDSSHRASSIMGSFASSHKSDSSDSMSERKDPGSRDEPDHHSIGLNQEETIDLSLEDDKSQGNPINQAAMALWSSHRSLLHGDQTPPSLAPSFPPPVRSSNPEPPIINFGDFQFPKKSIDSTTDAKTIPKYTFKSSDLNSTISLPPIPWSITSLVPPLIHYHLNDLSDSQLPSYLALYLCSYFPSLFAYVPTGNILNSYHTQLLSVSLFNEAASLRKACFPSYPEVYELGTLETQAGGWFCVTCRKPSKGSQHGFCTRCKKRWGLCPICDTVNDPIKAVSGVPNKSQSYSTRDMSSERLWAWCQMCGHGGHVGCLSVWWADAEASEGGCASGACLCDCVDGIRRGERIEEMERKREGRRGAVRRDSWVVGESRAVGRARGVLGRAGGGLGGLRGESGALSAGLTRITQSPSRKKVRLDVRPPKEDDGEKTPAANELPEGEDHSRSVP